MPHHVLRLDDGAVQIRTAGSAARIRGPSIGTILRQLCALLDGTRTEAEILARYAASARARQTAAQVIASLRRNQMLEELDPLRAPATDRDDSLGRYLASMSRDRSKPAGNLVAGRVGVFAGTGGTDGLAAARVAQAIRAVVPACDAREALDAAGVSGLTHAVVVCPEPAVVHEPARALNDLAVEAGISVSFVAILGPDVLQIGPAVYPTETACLTCIELAFRRNNPLPLRLEELAADVGMDPALVDSAAFAAAAQLAALDALHAVSRVRRAASASRILTVRLDGLTMSTVSFTRAPRCGSCGGTRFAPPMRIWA